MNDLPENKYNYTSEIKSDLTIPEQIIESYYNKVFYAKCSQWAEEQMIKYLPRHDNVFEDYNDYKKYVNATSYWLNDDDYERYINNEIYRGRFKHYIRYKLVKGETVEARDYSNEVKECRESYRKIMDYRDELIVDYHEVFGWENPDHAFIDLKHEYLERHMDPKFKKEVFNNFIECYPQYETQSIIFEIILFIVIEFTEANYMCAGSGYLFPYVDLKGHIELLEDMAEFFRRKPRTKSARSAIH